MIAVASNTEEKVNTSAWIYSCFGKDGFGAQLVESASNENLSSVTLVQMNDVLVNVLSLAKKGYYIDQYLQVISLIIKRIISSKTSDVKEDDILETLISLSTAKDKNIRARVCYLLGHVSWSSVPSTGIECLIVRCTDSTVVVRVEALRSLSKFMSRAESSKIYLVLKEALRADVSFEVRKTILQAIPVEETTILDVIESTVDIKDVVRRSAYKRILEEAPLGLFMSSYGLKLDLISNGVDDRDLEVRQTLIRIIEKWVNEEQLDLFHFVDSLKPRENLKVIKEFLKMLFENSDVANDLEFWSNPVADIVSDTTLAVLFRCRLEYLKKSNNDEDAEQLVPDIGEFCDTLKQSTTKLQVISEAFEVEGEIDEATLEQDEARLDFVLQMLLEMAPFLDANEDLTTSEMLGSCLENMMLTYCLSEELIQKTCNVLADLLSFDEFSDKVSIGVKNILDLAKQGVIDEGAELDESALFILRALTLSNVLLQRAIMLQNEIPLELKLIIQQIAVQTFNAPFVALKQVVVEVLGLLVISGDVENDSTNLEKIIAMLRAPKQDVSVQQSSLKAICDCLKLKPGLERKLLPELMISLEHKELRIKIIAVRGLSQFCFMNGVMDDGIMLCLISSLFLLKTDDEEEIRQLLTSFFPLYIKRMAPVGFPLESIFSMLVANIESDEPDELFAELPVMKILNYILVLAANASPTSSLRMISKLMGELVKFPFSKDISKLLANCPLQRLTTEGLEYVQFLSVLPLCSVEAEEEEQTRVILEDLDEHELPESFSSWNSVLDQRNPDSMNSLRTKLSSGASNEDLFASFSSFIDEETFLHDLAAMTFSKEMAGNNVKKRTRRNPARTARKK